MKTPNFFMTPDYTPVVRMMAMQTRFAIETSQGFMKLAMMPWAGLPTGFGSICTPMGSVTVASTVVDTAPKKPAPAKKPAKPAADVVEATAVEVTEKAPVKADAPAPKAAPVAKAPKAAPAKAAPKPEAPKAKAGKPEPKAEAPKAAPTPEVAKAEPKAEAQKSAPKPEVAKVAPKAEEAPKTKPVAAEPAATEAAAENTAAMIKPKAIAKPKGKTDDLTVLNGVGPKLAEALNAEGIYTYAQIADWSEANVAWMDENLPGVKGSASRNGWVAQAAELAV